MATQAVIGVDLADVWQAPGRDAFVRTLSWGDRIAVTKTAARHLEIETVEFEEQPDGSILQKRVKGFIEPTKTSGLKPADVVRPAAKNDVLKVNFIDVQQGDGAVIESPDGKVILVDGGDNQLFARYLAGRFRGTTPAKPKAVDCILVTHGDADHFEGLAKIIESETNKEKRKRFFMAPKRVYHNGIVKRATTRNKKKVPDLELLGATKKKDGDTYLVDLVDDLLQVPNAEMNEPFKNWKAALAEYNKRSPVELRRLEFGDHAAFDFFKKGDLRIEVLGPLATRVGDKPALKFLGKPPRGPRIGHESLDVDDKGFTGFSAAHTINGHSIVFRLVYGGFSYLFSGDLNDEASRFLAREHNRGALNLTSEVYKVAHHGSADFSGGLLQAIAPIVSVVSSGDENKSKEYIHPRATLMGALGKWSRVPEPLIFVTELVAFFNVEGFAQLTDKTKGKKRGEFFAFSRTAFGSVKTRTDGRRLLVYTDSGNIDMKEAYVYSLDANGVPQPAEVVRA